MLKLSRFNYGSCGSQVVIMNNNTGILHAYVDDCRNLVIIFANKAKERSWYHASTKINRKAWRRACQITKLPIQYSEWAEKFTRLSNAFDSSTVLREKGFSVYELGGKTYLYDKSKFGYCGCTNELLPIEQMTKIGDECVPTDRLDEFTFVCSECGKRHMKDCAYPVYHEDGTCSLMCPICKDEKAFYCHDCCKYYDMSMHCEEENRNLCKKCREKYVVCSKCGNLILKRNAVLVNGEYLCDYCVRDIKYKVRGYHDNPELAFHKIIGEPTEYKYIGTEVETEGTNDSLQQYIDRILCTDKYGKDNNGDPEFYIYQMHDGSLNSHGIECITQPMSKKFFDAYDFESWMRDLVNCGARATSSTGLHVHLSREWLDEESAEQQDILVGRMRQFIGDNKELVETFARRCENRWCEYKKSFDKDDKPSTKEEREDKHKSNAKFSTRYTSVNNTNEATIEFRIFAGTLDPTTYRASVEFCLRLVDYIKTHDENTETWKEFITYKPLPDSMKTYMTSRGMDTEFNQ